MNSECPARTVQHPKNIQTALENYKQLLALLSTKGSKDFAVFQAAQAELAELLRLHSMVKEFIESSNLTDDNAVSRSCHNAPGRTTMLLCDLCDIVGYVKE